MPGEDEKSGAAKATVCVPADTVVTVRTPGGGGHGDPSERNRAKREQDRIDGKVGDENDRGGDA